MSNEGFDAIKKEVQDVINLYQNEAKNGWSGLFSLLFKASSDLIEIVEASSAVVKSAKKETVVEGFKYAYKEINPDLPWIPEPFETKIETWILDNALPIFIDWIVKKYNDKGIFTHS